MADSNLNLLGSNFTLTLNKYNKWKSEKATRQNASFTTFLQMTKGTSLVSSWEKNAEALANKSDNINGNTVSLERFYQDKDGKMFFQALDGTVIQVDSAYENGEMVVKTTQLTEQDLVKAYGEDAEALLFGYNDIKMLNYNFSGEKQANLGDANIRKDIIKDVNAFVVNHSGDIDLTTIFGAVEPNVTSYSEDKKSITITQNGSTYVGKLDGKGQFSITKQVANNNAPTLLSSTDSTTLDKYNQWKVKTGRTTVSFMTYLQLYGGGANSFLANLETNLRQSKGIPENQKENLLSLDRYCEQGNSLYFQSTEGTVIKIDKITGETIPMTEKELAASLGKEAVLFGPGKMEGLDYDFAGDNKLDLSAENDRTKMINTVSTYAKNHAGQVDLTAIFGNDAGKDANVMYSNGNKTMVVIQDGAAYLGQYTDAEGLQLTKLNGVNSFDNYFEQDGKIYLQSKDGTIRTIDNTGQVTTTTEQDYALSLGKRSVTIGNDGIKTVDYSFAGDNKLNLMAAPDLDIINKAVGFYAQNNNGDVNLKNIFGANSGPDGKVVYSQDNKSMMIIQDGAAYLAQYGNDNKLHLTRNENYCEQDNKLYMQTENDFVAVIDNKTGALTQLTQAQLALEMGKRSVTIANDGLKTVDYSFVGNSRLELNSADDLGIITSAVGIYAQNHAGDVDLTQVFGAASGQAANVSYSSDKKSMVIVQGDTAYLGKYTDGQGLQLAKLDNANYSLLGVQPDASRTIQSVSYSIDSNGKPNVKFTYVDNTGATKTETKVAQGTGDPHFAFGGRQVFDFQGAAGGSEGRYNLLSGSGVNLDADFVKAYTASAKDGSTVMGSFHMTLDTPKGKVQFDYANGGAYTVKIDGKTITNPSEYGLEVTKSGSNAIVKYNNRTFTFSGINVYTDSIKAGETGILTQGSAIYDGKISKTDFNQMMQYSNCSAISAPVAIVTGDKEYVNELAQGLIDTLKYFGGSYIDVVLVNASSNIKNKPNLDYTTNPDSIKGTAQEKSEIFARLARAAAVDTTCPDSVKKQVFANWISLSSQAMLTDMNASKDGMASRFQAGHGYSTSQWNEFVGTLEFAREAADVNKDGKKDKILDVDSDGQIDGFDIDDDGILDENEKVRYNFADYFNDGKSINW